MKSLSLVIILLFFGFLWVSPIFSQDLAYEKSYEDYLFKLDTYRKEYSEFTSARDFYNSTPTLNLKERVRLELYDMLKAREDLLDVYFQALRARLAATPDHPGNQKADILNTLIPESEWYREHINTYMRDSDTLETLFSKSKVSESRYDRISSPIVYEALSTMAFSKYLDLKISHENVYVVILAEVENREGSERDLFNRWTADIDAEFQNITDIENSSREIRERFSSSSSSKKSVEIYSDLLVNLDLAEGSFRAINGYLGEMLAALKLNGI